MYFRVLFIFIFQCTAFYFSLHQQLTHGGCCFGLQTSFWRSLARYGAAAFFYLRLAKQMWHNNFKQIYDLQVWRGEGWEGADL